MSTISWLKDLKKGDAAFVGEKAAMLGEIFSMAPVPNGFVLKSTVFQRMVSNHRQKLQGVLIDSQLENSDKAEKIQGLIRSFEMPHDIQKEISEAYTKLGVDYSTVKSAFDLVNTEATTPVVVRANLFVERDDFREDPKLIRAQPKRTARPSGAVTTGK